MNGVTKENPLEFGTLKCSTQFNNIIRLHVLIIFYSSEIANCVLFILVHTVSNQLWDYYDEVKRNDYSKY